MTHVLFIRPGHASFGEPHMGRNYLIAGGKSYAHTGGVAQLWLYLDGISTWFFTHPLNKEQQHDKRTP